MKFENKVVVVTGASSGIGEGVAKMFLEEGAKVVGCGIEPEMKIQDSSAIYVQADLTKFDQAVAEGKLTYVVGTNLTYRMPELLTRDWYVDVDVSKYAAYFVVALNHDMSVSSIIDPLKKIENLLASRK